MKMPDPSKTIGFTVKIDKDGNKDFNFSVEDIVLLLITIQNLPDNYRSQH